MAGRISIREFVFCLPGSRHFQTRPIADDLKAMPRNLAISEPHTKTSLADIARQLEVSISTVSRVLNGKPGISEEVRNRVNEALHSSAYRKRPKAAKRASSNTIAFLVSKDLFARINEGNDFYGRHLFAVQKAIVEAGYYPIFLTESQERDMTARLRCLTERKVQGVIAECWDREFLEALAKEVPTVLFNRISPRIDSVTTNMRLAARQQFEYLYQLGHRRIACFRVFVEGMWENIDYWQQYWALLREYGLCLPPVFSEPVSFGRHEDDLAANAFIKAILAKGATAILTYDNYIPALVRALAAHGIEVPTQMSLVGFNDFNGLWKGDVQQPNVKITTYRQDFVSLAKEAMQLLIARIKTPDRPPRLVQIGGELIIRTSAVPPQS